MKAKIAYAVAGIAVVALVIAAVLGRDERNAVGLARDAKLEEICRLAFDHGAYFATWEKGLETCKERYGLLVNGLNSGETIEACLFAGLPAFCTTRDRGLQVDFLHASSRTASRVYLSAENANDLKRAEPYIQHLK